MSVLFALFSAFATTPATDEAPPEPTWACPATVMASLPTLNADLVPTTLTPSLLVPTCAGGAELLVVVQSLSDGELVLEDLDVVVPPVQQTGAQVVQLPTVDLDPDTDYELTVAGDGVFERIAFTTGHDVGTDTVFPTIELGVLYATAWEDGYGTMGQVELEVYGTHAGIHRITSPDLPGLDHGFAGIDGTVWLDSIALDDLEVCFDVESLDARGDWHHVGSTCVNFAEDVDYDGLYDEMHCGYPFGCSTTGAPSGGFAVLLGTLSLFGLRRRTSAVPTGDGLTWLLGILSLFGLRRR